MVQTQACFCQCIYSLYSFKVFNPGVHFRTWNNCTASIDWSDILLKVIKTSWELEKNLNKNDGKQALHCAVRNCKSTSKNKLLGLRYLAFPKVTEYSNDWRCVVNKCVQNQYSDLHKWFYTQKIDGLWSLL